MLTRQREDKKQFREEEPFPIFCVLKPKAETLVLSIKRIVNNVR